MGLLKSQTRLSDQTTTIYQSVLFLAEGWYFFFQYIRSFVFAENGSYDVLLLLVMNVDGS